MSLLTISNLDVQYGKKIALKNMHLSISAGEIVTIVGPNGSGKTSLFKAIIGTAPITRGKIEIGSNVTIGYVPQHLNIDGSLPINVNRFLKLGKPTDQNAYNRSLEIMGTERLLGYQMANLSGGELQRVLLCRALIDNPDMLLLDEATRGLDQPGAAEFYQKIETIRNETSCAVLMISHDLHVVMSASDRVICLNGHICCQGAPGSVASSPEYKALFGSDVEGAFALYQHRHDHKHGIDGKIL